MDYLVSQDRTCSRLWMVSGKPAGAPAGDPWATLQSLGFHKTAKDARAALRSR